MASVKTAISLDSDLLKEVDDLSKQLKISRSHLFVLSVHRFMKDYQNRKLLESINNAFEDGLTDEEKDINERIRKQHSDIARGQWS